MTKLSLSIEALVTNDSILKATDSVSVSPMHTDNVH